ncbi:NF-kappa-B inhibitor zeta-like [Scomber scombrus]|uniref:NF-kappa-B inhibitor zeta-like n=1 Tax=Scomber scombrus TaxID=13677 RepID=UPI002DDBAD46|nr:NF-kappa-B inhibitor zeta-like [Scomber scombrus]
MLDQIQSQTRRGQFLPAGINSGTNGFFTTDHKPPEVMQKTVKQLLVMSRQVSQGQQKRKYCHDDNSEHKYKSVKFEAFDVSPPAPANLNMTPYFPAAAPEHNHITPPHMQHSPLQGPMAPTSEFKMTLFQWQIQHEAQKLEGISPEIMHMQDADGDTFLHIAVAQGKRALAYVLAAKMAERGSLDIKEHNGQTPLQLAAAINQHLIVQDLLLQGAQINTRDLWGRSPLHVCAEKGHYLSIQNIWNTLLGSGQSIDVEMFNYDGGCLIKYCSVLSLSLSEGLTPLHAAVLSHNTVMKDLRIVESTCSYMATELMQRRQTYIECIKTLLLMGASYGTKDLKSGRTCLHIASEEANVELLSIFLEHPSSLTFVNVKTFSGNTALHIASSLPNHKIKVEAVKLLMRKGADPGARNFENELPAQLVPEGPTGEKVRQILKGKYINA